MNLQQLFTMQKELDDFIEKTKGVSHEVFQEKVLALSIELAELANETRCFKYWSNKESSIKSVLLEEFVDSIHFLLSIGLEKSYVKTDYWRYDENIVYKNLTELFLIAQNRILHFFENQTEEKYRDIWYSYVAIAKNLNFTVNEIINAYQLKHAENYNRQSSGY